METVFITILAPANSTLDLSEDARIRYCSESIEDILGYLPHEVLGKSCWDYFHPEEIPFAREVHGRGVSLDKASVLSYCRVQHKDGSWIGWPKAKQRELASGAVRRIFSSSPRDPRYHMLSYLSNKFTQQSPDLQNEPRAALFLNRFTRTSTVMHATDGVSSILGLAPDELIGRSFYYCITENCLPDAVKTLESAKANDSIAYLRFRYRNPLQDHDNGPEVGLPEDTSDEDDDGGVALGNGPRSGSSVSMTDAPTSQPSNNASTPSSGPNVTSNQSQDPHPQPVSHSSTDGDLLQPPSEPTDLIHRSSSGNSTDLGPGAAEAIFDPPERGASSSSSTPRDDSSERGLELEAVVSCSSDGLVVILRRAKPLVPPTLGVTEADSYTNGLFASPWAPQPVLPSGVPQDAVESLTSSTDTSSVESGFMAAIRDVAVFAWSLTGINGSLVDYASGSPVGESQPPGGLPIWDPNADADPHDLYNGFSGSAHRPFDGMDEPVRMPRKEDELGSSDDEVLWKRSTTMPAWRRPKRRGHGDAFGGPGENPEDGQDQYGGRKRTTKSSSGSRSGAGTTSSSGQDQSGSGSGSGSATGSGAGSVTGSS
ncbi:hypothetical protein B0A52_07124 [Exophiala mesophila]|uniref:PAS domain-containing protein n=1 Tax=Exophiala mesophila TaxID=212818 RepID=A0A438MZG6_EXOME|nr:hypothetical protein B0A52_07124 [Exophiala mesophila]